MLKRKEELDKLNEELDKRLAKKGDSEEKKDNKDEKDTEGNDNKELNDDKDRNAYDIDKELRD